MKRGKELNLTLNHNYKTSVGTVDNKNPKSVYINISTWGEPIFEVEDKKNYENKINKIRRDVRQSLFTNLDGSLFKTKSTIVDLDLRSSGISNDKRSFMCCEAVMFQKKMLPVNSSEMKDELEVLCGKILHDVLETNDDFSFHLKKV